MIFISYNVMYIDEIFAIETFLSLYFWQIRSLRANFNKSSWWESYFILEHEDLRNDTFTWLRLAP